MAGRRIAAAHGALGRARRTVGKGGAQEAQGGRTGRGDARAAASVSLWPRPEHACKRFMLASVEARWAAARHLPQAACSGCVCAHQCQQGSCQPILIASGCAGRRDKAHARRQQWWWPQLKRPSPAAPCVGSRGVSARAANSLCVKIVSSCTLCCAAHWSMSVPEPGRCNFSECSRLLQNLGRLWPKSPNLDNSSAVHRLDTAPEEDVPRAVAMPVGDPGGMGERGLLRSPLSAVRPDINAVRTALHSVSAIARERDRHVRSVSWVEGRLHHGCQRLAQMRVFLCVPVVRAPSLHPRAFDAARVSEGSARLLSRSRAPSLPSHVSATPFCVWGSFQTHFPCASCGAHPRPSGHSHRLSALLALSA